MEYTDIMKCFVINKYLRLNKNNLIFTIKYDIGLILLYNKLFLF